MSIFSKNHVNDNLRSAIFVSLLTLISRITGMLQSRLVASCLGIGFAADAFMIAFRLPNLLRRFSAEGTMTSALITTLSEVETKNGIVAGKNLVAKFLGTLFLILIAANLIIIPIMSFIAGLQILGHIAPDLVWYKQISILWNIIIGKTTSPIELILVTKLARIMFPYLSLVSITAGFSAVLNLRKQFGLPALTSTVWNLTFIIFVMIGLKFYRSVLNTTAKTAVYLSLAVIVAGITQLFVVWPTFKQLGFQINFGCYWHNKDVQKVINRMIPGLLGTGIHPINVVISTILASQLTVGAQTILFNSNMMGEMVLGIFATSLATVSLPTMSKLVVSGKMNELCDSLIATMRYTALLIIPGAIGMSILALPIIAIIFHTGYYDITAVIWTANTLKYQAFGLLFIATNRIIVQCLYALGDYKSPVYAALLGMVTNIVLSIILMKSLKTSGIALANGLSSLASLVFLVFTVNKKLTIVSWIKVVNCWLLSSLASTLMGILAYVSMKALKLDIISNTLKMCLKLFPLIGFCALVYLSILIMLHVTEAKLFGCLINKKLNFLSKLIK